ncbi:hypothetical protein FGG08_005376 [Glutinoglossum americanum]|uniref:Uncharacterized protein n=1 Tax=Glutinoglossum americanum TaxID=1670608 RepID=A0A9P8I9K0_9PEZI|nr:hypothetical protein FGG08_005376 [Glutinoglossum americanum]
MPGKSIKSLGIILPQAPKEGLRKKEKKVKRDVAKVIRDESRTMIEKTRDDVDELVGAGYRNIEGRMAHKGLGGVARSLLELEEKTKVFSCPPKHLHPDVPLDVLREVWDKLSSEPMLPPLTLVSGE